MTTMTTNGQDSGSAKKHEDLRSLYYELGFSFFHGTEGLLIIQESEV